MKTPRVRRRWVVLAMVVILALGVVRLLYQPLTLESYRELDRKTLVVQAYGAPGAWTRVSDVTETASTVTISADAFTFEPFPHTDMGARLDIQVQVNAPLGTRVVFDGSTGQPLTRLADH